MPRGMSFIEHGKDFHEVANKKMNVYEELKTFRDLINDYVLSKKYGKIEVFIPDYNKPKSCRFDKIPGKMYERVIYFDDDEKEYYVYARNKKWYVKPIDTPLNSESRGLWTWTAYNY
ncbi:MAG: hypothetical protein ACOCP8_05300 [archaeon]